MKKRAVMVLIGIAVGILLVVLVRKQAVLVGSGKRVDLSGSQAGSFELRDFNAGDVTINLSLASHVIVSAYGSLSGELNGASSLIYRGEPKLGSLKTSSDSSILRE